MICSWTIEDLRIQTYLFDKQTASPVPFVCSPHPRLIATWNKQNPSERIKVSDRLLAVNGITQVKENLAEELHLGLLWSSKKTKILLKVLYGPSEVPLNCLVKKSCKMRSLHTEAWLKPHSLLGGWGSLEMRRHTRWTSSGACSIQHGVASEKLLQGMWWLMWSRWPSKVNSR